MKKILIIEDEVFWLLRISRLLRPTQAQLIFKRAPFEKLQDMQEGEDYDAIIIDVDDPLIYAYQYSMLMRMNGYKKPIIAHGYDIVACVRMAFKGAMDYYVVKHDHTSELIPLLGHLGIAKVPAEGLKPLDSRYLYTNEDRKKYHKPIPMKEKEEKDSDL